MKHKNMIIMAILMVLLSFTVNAYPINLNILDSRWIIEKQDYFQEYIEYNFYYVNEYTTRVEWRIKDKNLFQLIKKCEIKDDDCIDKYSKENKETIKDYEKNIKGIFGSKYTYSEFKESYFEVEKNKKIDEDIISLKKNSFPKQVDYGDITILGDVSPLNKESGEFYIYQNKAELKHARFRIGFGTLIVTLSNGYSNELINLSIGDYYINTIKRYINVPLYSQIDSAYINFTGELGQNSKFKKYDYFDDGSINYTAWDIGLGIYGGISESGNKLTVIQNALDGGHYNTSIFTENFDLRNNSYAFDYDLTFDGYGCSFGAGSIAFAIKVTDETTGINLYVKSSPCTYSETRRTVIVYHNKSDNKITVYNPIGTIYSIVNSASLNISRPWQVEVRLSAHSTIPYYDKVTLNMYLSGYKLNSSIADHVFQSENPFNISIKVGGTEVYSNESNFAGNISQDILTELDASLNGGDCDCAGCLKYTSYCSVPLTFYSGRGGLINFTGILADINITSGNLTVNIYDVDDTALITENMTIQIISDEYQQEGTTTSGTYKFTFPFNTSNDYTLNTRSFQTLSNDYSIANQYVTLSTGEAKTINFYLINTSDSTDNEYIQFITLDEDKNRMPGAKIKIYKQNPLTNQYILLTEIYTNPEGKVTTRLRMNDFYYRFIVEYKGNIVYTSSYPVSLSPVDSPVTLNCITRSGYAQSLVNYLGTDISLSFERLSNSSGYYTLNYLSGSTVEVCADIYHYINTVKTDVQYYCENSTSGLLTFDTITVTQFAQLEADIYLNIYDGYGKVKILQDVRYLGLDDLSRSHYERLIIFFALIIICGLLFIANPLAGLLVFVLGILGITFTKFTLMTMPMAMLIVSLTIITFITVAKNEVR